MKHCRTVEILCGHSVCCCVILTIRACAGGTHAQLTRRHCLRCGDLSPMAEGGEEGGVDPLAVSLQKLDDELTCPVCSEHFKEPKVLPCLHCFCKTCIADQIKYAEGDSFQCPKCRHEVQVTNNDVNR